MIKIYPTLFSRTITGAVQIWYIEQDKDKYRSVSGQKHGQHTVSEWTEAEPKNIGKTNETTGEEQAASEIECKYIKQLKSGYFLLEKDIDNFQTFWPMLALSKPYKDYRHTLKDIWKLGIGVQTKYNGCISGETKLETLEYGVLSIKEIVDKHLSCQVLSLDIHSNKLEYKPVINYFLDKDQDKSPEWFEVETISGVKIKLTGNHLVFLPKLNIWRRADELSALDEIQLN